MSNATKRLFFMSLMFKGDEFLFRLYVTLSRYYNCIFFYKELSTCLIYIGFQSYKLRLKIARYLFFFALFNCCKVGVLLKIIGISIKCLLPVEFVLVSPFMSLSVTKIYNVCVESKMTTNELKITL